jgi:hypothetical protein
MSPQAAAYYRDNPSAAEITAVLGDGWAICRNTAKMRERYKRCITLKVYNAAKAEALARRVIPGVPNE